MNYNNSENTINDSKKLSFNINDYMYIGRDDITEFNVPKDTISIGKRSFSKCKNLKKIILPDSITSIGDSAFSDCENLEEIILPKNLKKINYRTFAGCKRLKKIIIPEGVEEIDWAAFADCENLEEIILPNSIKKINKQIFLNCKKLKKVTLPKNITSLPDECFKGCKKLDIILNKKITELGNSVFEGCTSLSNYPTQIIKAGKNCFKKCSNLKTITINKNISELADSIFDNCQNLKTINYNGITPLKLGKKSFRNCKSLTAIPTFIANYNEQSFENCTGLTEIDIIDSYIPFACFRNCKNISIIHNQDNIHKLGAFSFSGCVSLEEIILKNPTIIPPESFSNCKNLKRVRLNNYLTEIDTRGFYNCPNLKDINISDMVSIIKKEAFKYCHSITYLKIPANLEHFGNSAFSYMDSLEKIEVSPHNKTFITPDNKILINQISQKLVLYASGLKDKTYSLKNYNYPEKFLITPINSIGEYAFAGNKNLEELILCCCTSELEHTAFFDCPKLKNLIIESIPLYTIAGFNLLDHGRFYMKNHSKTLAQMPFEKVTFCLGYEDEDNFVGINNNALPCFNNVKQLCFPKSGNYFIGSNAFIDSVKLKVSDIPNNVSSITKNSFPSDVILNFENGLSIQGLTELSSNNQYVGKYKLYDLGNERFYIEENNKTTYFTKEDIDKSCSHSKEIRDNPILFFDFKKDLSRHDLDIEQLSNGILFSKMSLANRKILFDNLKKEDTFFLKTLKDSKILDNVDNVTTSILEDNNFSNVVKIIEILKKHNIEEPILHNKLFMSCCEPENFENLITFDTNLLIKVINDSNLINIDLNNKDITPEYDLTNYILVENTLSNFLYYVKKYNIKDRYLIDKSFISICDNPLAEDFFKNYDANTKILLNASKTPDNHVSARQNLNDLLTLLKITGALEDDPIIKQKATTFITEKMFSKELPNGEKNKFLLIGNDIHSVFNFNYLNRGFDKEFSEFFLENYQELVATEKRKAGFIQRVYLNFKQISKTSTSDKGSQRKLKVTIEKCKNYLSTVKFDNVSAKDRDFAELIGEWFDDNTVWLNAKKIYEESKKAPRNIFTEINSDSDNNIIYDNNPINDLKEENSTDFSYEWLPKQSKENLVLGKYCNCCAHISGAGQGIMRASMILDCCQNLIIRNEWNEIISKSTIFVNKERGYAVFNTVETSLNYRDKVDQGKIYKAFLRGATAFVDTYNKNNESNPISNISIGTNRNQILDYLTDDLHPNVKIQPAINYGNYSLPSSGNNYDGDWKSGQKLVLKK